MVSITFLTPGTGMLFLYSIVFRVSVVFCPFFRYTLRCNFIMHHFCKSGWLIGECFHCLQVLRNLYWLLIQRYVFICDYQIYFHIFIFICYFCLMNDHVKSLYVALVDNKVIAQGTNKMDFFKSFASAAGYKLGYYSFRKLLKNDDYYPVTISGVEYHFQQLVK